MGLATSSKPAYGQPGGARGLAQGARQQLAQTLLALAVGRGRVARDCGGRQLAQARNPTI
eukprot:scaffold22126_cov70-Phaeocystis_antarctica.AAC.4